MQTIDETKDEINKDELKEFISKSRARLQAILERLHWTEQKTLQPMHDTKTAADTTDSDEEPELPASSVAKHKNVLTETELRQLLNDDNVQIPEKFSDLQVNFSSEQKLCIYEHVIEQTGKCTEPEVILPALQRGQLTFAEIVAQQKREKKNKRRHRTSKPSHIEQVRGLVDLQMQALQQYLDTNTKDNVSEKSKESSKRRESRQRREERHRKDMQQSRSEHRFDSRRRRRSYSKERLQRRNDSRRSRSQDRKYHKRDDKHVKQRSSSRKRSRSRSRYKHKHKSRHSRSSSRSRQRNESRSRQHSGSRSRQYSGSCSRQRSGSRSRQRNESRSRRRSGTYRKSNRSRSREKKGRTNKKL